MRKFWPRGRYRFSRLYLDAMEFVVQLPQNNKLLLLSELHKLIMRGHLPRRYVGWYRDRIEVTLGGKFAAPAVEVGELMVEHLCHAIEAIEQYRTGRIRGKALEALLEQNLGLGLKIHPFVDGNGRTFRLYHNYLRQCCGLPWQTDFCREWEW